MVGVATGDLGETEQSVRDFVAQTGVTFPVLMDTGTFPLFDWDFGISPYPRQVVMNAEREVVWLSSTHDPDALRAVIEPLLTR